MSGSRIAFVLTGSIAGYKACDAISRLVKLGHSVCTQREALELADRAAGKLEIQVRPRHPESALAMDAS